MLIWDDAQTMVKDWSGVGDQDTSSLTKFKRYMNLGYKDLLHVMGVEELEDIRSTTTEASTRAIKLPQNYIRIHEVSATIGTQEYPVFHERSRRRWLERVYANRTSSRPTHFYIQPRVGVNGAELLLDPIPSDANTTIRIYYDASVPDLSQDKYTTGTVEVVKDSPTVTGTSTVFAEAMENRYFKVDGANGDGMWYRITDYTNGTSITLENDYQERDISGQSYIVAEAFHLPEPVQIGPLYFCMWHWYAGDRKDKDELMRNYWQKQYEMIRSRAEKLYARKDKSNVLDDPDGRSSPWPVYPGHFPTEVT